MQNIVIGGAAGAVPALVGWAAVRGGLGAPAWILFAVVFFWTPAHFWALAVKYRDDYARGRHPDAARSCAASRRRRRQIAALRDDHGRGHVRDDAHRRRRARVYAVVGARARRAVRRPGRSRSCATPTPQRAIQFFGWSNVYLMLVFVAVAVDALVR